jgi:hypothetical protein
MVFDPAEAPRDRARFLEWYGRTTEWSEGHSYNDPGATTPELHAWYDDIRNSFPNMNGPGAPDDDHINDTVTDYSIGHHAIYAAFAWSEAETAYPLVRRLAVEHRVGFYDVSGDEGDGEIYFPGDQLRPPSGGAWHKISKEFKELKSQ